MKVLMLTLGTRGDVQPYVAFALELGKAGHEAVLAAPEMFEAFVTGHGVAFAALDDGPMRLMDTSGVREAMEGGVWARVALARQLPKLFGGLLEDAWAVASGGRAPGRAWWSTTARSSPASTRRGEAASPRRPRLAHTHVRADPGVPLAGAVFASEASRADEPHHFRGDEGGDPGLRPHGGRLAAAEAGAAAPPGPPRDDPLLRPDGGPAPVLHAFSPRVLPPPSDWPRTVTTTGYWFLPPKTDASARTEASGGSLPDGLADFLGAGEPPVFVGSGSMAGRDPKRTAALVAKAVRRARVRAVLATGWGGLEVGGLPDELFVVYQVPYERLFPRVAAVVHHGGAGTTGAAAASGRRSCARSSPTSRSGPAGCTTLAWRPPRSCRGN